LTPARRPRAGAAVRPVARRSAVVGLGAATTAALLAARRWSARSRATAAERRAPLPGDGLVPDPMWQATRAITVRASREDVWPWLVQMGFPSRRAGWYTPFWLDRLAFGIRARSAETIIPRLQDLAVGDRVPDSESGASFFTVARLEPARALVLFSTTHPLPAYSDVRFSWAFALRDAPAGSRLVMRARVAYTPVWPAPLVRLLVFAGFGAGDIVQAGGMLLGIRRRAERRAAALATARGAPQEAAVDLYWIPLGAGGHSVRFNGRVYEALAATRARRARRDLYHAALIVTAGGERYAIEIAPSPDANEDRRGVVATGAVGTRAAGRLRLFRYEVRCWRGGSIPDLAEAVGGAHRLSADPPLARRVLELVRDAPTPVWGRDELDAGEAWNSNSLIAWLLLSAGLPADRLQPPPGGRAPGWDAGLETARRVSPA